MKIKKTPPITFLNFLDRIHYNAEEIDPEMVTALLSKINQFISHPFFSAHVVFAIDYSKRQYLFWENNHYLGGFDPAYVINEGIEITQKFIDEKYFKLFNERVFPHFINKIKKKDREIYMSLNYKVKCITGEWMHWYQKSVYILCPHTGLPLICVGMNMDVTDFKTDGYITSTIEMFERETNKMELVDKSTFNVMIDDLRLTNREILMIHYLNEGLSSKLIADKLKISINTVHNHRQNILRKTNCRNVAELIGFTSRNGIK